jgi:hypothetical protein
MFGKPPQDSNPSQMSDIKDDILGSQNPVELTNQQEEGTFMNRPEEDNPEMVNTVEKISKIVSPYFIVLVGLLLYDENFLLGLILIVTGVFGLLKISFKDIANWFKSIKNFWMDDE